MASQPDTDPTRKASEGSPPPIISPLGTPSRHTTTHDPTTHLSIFAPPTTLPNTLTPYGTVGMVVFDGYKTFSSPLDMTAEADIAALKKHPDGPAPEGGVWFPGVNQTILRYCDWAPNSTLPYHRTETIDLGVVTHGTMELTLDSGEMRLLRVGDTLVQRGTLHAWRNPSATEWARVVFFLLGAPPVRVGGEEKAEYLPWQEKGQAKEGEGSG
ncbi:hypothetical protein B0T19DRAFT_472487 [Cercophora scortea]|uniref:Uncharacterized protein n=1 Tax=Cercophora scortea TaxID=314031 RepID=A0AAE0J638_9PEZI|nr:hypothetical protein B0T19DRAFT_472487 [Cercophora scortea]